MANGFALQPTHSQANAKVRTTPACALVLAARCWFVTAVAGQWLFVYYIVAFYGGPTARGEFSAWNRNPLVQHGFIAGDFAGNLVFALHVLVAAALTVSGTLQLVPAIRKRLPVLHRWNGRMFIGCAFAVSIAGLYLELARQGDAWLGSIAILVNGTLIMLFAGMAWHRARQRRLASHRRWALRTFIAVSGVWFLRVAVGQSLFGFTPALTETGFAALGLASYLVPLAVLELYLHARDSEQQVFRVGVAGLVAMLTALMALGIAGAFIFLWRPLL